jgi:N-acetylglucosamine kinase-like BadF-type ATPase
MEYVIGVEGGVTRCLMKAVDLKGNTVAERSGGSVNHSIVGARKAARLVTQLLDALLKDFDGRKEDCRCIVVGAAGIDSPSDRLIVERFYASQNFPCPIFCMNDGTVALYGATKGVGLLAVSDMGSIVVGRNKQGKRTRSGGYSLSIMGDEGSARWISIMALNHMSKWVDESVPSTRLVDNIVDYFHGFDANKLIQCITHLQKRQVNPEIAFLVYSAAEDGDAAAENILKSGARALFDVACTVVVKLGFESEPRFMSGMWGSVFHNSRVFKEAYRQMFSRAYPNCELVCPDCDGSDSAARMALDYLSGRARIVAEL